MLSYLFAFVLFLHGCRWYRRKWRKAWAVPIEVPENAISLAKVGNKGLLNNFNSTWNDNK
jgi:G:T-mismatch repair DNA endonuclease (very short patch repair protein)